jgi:peptidoglycan-associated lipoprotein
MGSKFNGWFFMLAAAVLIGLACGGSKQTVELEPETIPAPPPEPVSQPPVVTPRPPVVNPADLLPKKPALVLHTVYFDFDQSVLTEQATTTLSENAEMLQIYPEINIRIEGHCDERGTVEYNLALGQRRALSVRNYLVNYGLNPGRMTVISYGKERPVYSRHNSAAWAKNRRAEFVILN